MHLDLRLGIINWYAACRLVRELRTRQSKPGFVLSRHERAQ